MDYETLGAAKAYVKATLVGEGALKGNDGKSSYELALENGYQGTLSEWLESLKGEKGDSGIEEMTREEMLEILNGGINNVIGNS